MLLPQPKRTHCCRLLSPFTKKRSFQVAVVVALLGAASYQGRSNIIEQRSIMGERIKMN